MKNVNNLNQLEKVVTRANYELDGDSTNYQHTHTRVRYSESNNTLHAEKLCINQYGSAYGLNEYAEINSVNCNPELFGSMGWMDIEA